MSDNLLATAAQTDVSDQPATGDGEPDQQKFTQKVTGQSDPKFFTQEDIEKVREQEKSKMYKRLETMQEQVARLEAQARQGAEAEEAKQREIAEAAKVKAESEMSAKDLLAQKEQEWQSQLQAVQQQVEAERALRQRETEFAQLMDYQQQIIAEYSDRVAPEMLDLIQGGSPEEIRASAEDMSERTARILAQTAEAMQNQRQQMPTTRATAPVSGDNSGSQRTLTPDEIRNMSMSEYAKQRQALLGGGADGPKNRGLFG
jgi:hypothetical protein